MYRSKLTWKTRGEVTTHFSSEQLLPSGFARHSKIYNHRFVNQLTCQVESVLYIEIQYLW